MGVAVEENDEEHSESLPLEILTGGIDIEAASETDSDDEEGLLGILDKEFAIPTEEFGADELTADTDPLTAYLRKLNHVEPLPAEKQQALAERYVEHNDVDAGKVLILTNLRLVVKLAKEYKRRWTNLLDLIQEGNVGLAEAITRFDPYRGVKFTSYAQYWIRAMILNYLMNNVHPVRLGNTRASRKLFYNLKKARRELRRQGYEPTADRVAQYLDVDKEEVVRVSSQLDSPPVSLESEAPGYEDTTVGELMEADTVDPEGAVSDYQFSNQIQEAIAEFGRNIEDERKRAIWFERMVAEDAKTLAELGDDWDVSKERIRQVEVQIRDDFKDFLTDELGDEIEVNWEDTLLAS